MRLGITPRNWLAAQPFARRSAIIAATWGGALPTRLTSAPTITANQTGVGNARDTWPADCSRVDQIAVPLPRGGVSRVHLCYPAASPALHAVRNKLVVMVNGHWEAYLSERNPGTASAYMMYRLLQEGFHVLAVCMPTDGFNASQSFAKLDTTPVTILSHDFSVLEADGVAPLRFFLDGAIVGLDYALNLLGFTTADAIGISGGGWTAEMVAALDTRIRLTIPVFASVPEGLRIAAGGPCDNGDWEQLPARSYWAKLGSYETVYVLGCIDPGRKRVQYLSSGNPGEPLFNVRTVLSQVSAYQARIDAQVPTGQHVIVLNTTSTGHWYDTTMINEIAALLAA